MNVKSCFFLIKIIIEDHYYQQFLKVESNNYKFVGKKKTHLAQTVQSCCFMILAIRL